MVGSAIPLRNHDVLQERRPGCQVVNSPFAQDTSAGTYLGVVQYFVPCLSILNSTTALFFVSGFKGAYTHPNIYDGRVLVV